MKCLFFLASLIRGDCKEGNEKTSRKKGRQEEKEERKERERLREIEENMIGKKEEETKRVHKNRKLLLCILTELLIVR
jgi:hypothetical protein